MVQSREQVRRRSCGLCTRITKVLLHSPHPFFHLCQPRNTASGSVLPVVGLAAAVLAG